MKSSEEDQGYSVVLTFGVIDSLGENGGTVVGLIVGQGEAVLFHQFCSCQLTTREGASLSERGKAVWRWCPIRPVCTLCGHGSSRNASEEETGMTESPVLQWTFCVNFLYACTG